MYNNDNHWTLFFFLERLADQHDAYYRIKSNEEEKATSTHFGKQAIKYNILYFVFMAACAALAIGAAVFLNDMRIWQAVIMIVFGLVLLPFAVIFFILALNCDIKQMKLNKLPIGLVSLIFTLLLLVAAIVAAVVTIVLLIG